MGTSFVVRELISRLRGQQSILALGTDTQPRLSWTKNGRLFSLEPKRSFQTPQDFFESAISFYIKSQHQTPRFILFDPHPLFFCGLTAQKVKKEFFPKAILRPIPHHVSHVANFGIEKGLGLDYIGLAWDGTGYGQDGCVWGGEFFVYRAKSFQRAAHFAYHSLPGNEIAIREPWRLAFAHLYGIYKKRAMDLELPFLKKISKPQLRLVSQMIEKRFNTPQSSSAGRLFDAVSALLDIKTHIQKEGEAAICLEAEAAFFSAKAQPYRFDCKEEKGQVIIDTDPMFKGLVTDLKKGVNRAQIAYRFHETMAEIACCVSCQLRERFKCNRVYYSGGVFMNKILTSLLEKRLARECFEVFAPQKPLNTDLGISQGQIAACLMEATCA